MSTVVPPSVIARFQFLPDRAREFVQGDVGEFVEMQFDDVDEVIEYCEAWGDALVDVTANVNGRIITLSEQPKE